MRTLVSALLLSLTFALSHSVEAQTLSQEIIKCSNVKNSLQRLVCYDRLAQRASGIGLRDVDMSGNVMAPAAPVTPVQPQANSNPQVYQQPQTYVAPASPEQRFGLEGQATREQNAEMEDLTASVSEIKKDQRGRLIVTLDNGHVWRQSRNESLRNLQVGDRVIISRGMLGAFYMKKDGTKQRIAVKRSK